jgi:hypothetical protein
LANGDSRLLVRLAFTLACIPRYENPNQAARQETPDTVRGSVKT